MAAAPNIPFKRNGYPPDAAPGKVPSTDGEDWEAVRRALSRAGFIPWDWATGQNKRKYSNSLAHGNGDAPGMTAFQASVGITPAYGWYGNPTHEALRKYRVPTGLPNAGEWAFDQTAINLYKGYEDESAAQKVVKDIEYWCEWLENEEPRVYYSQARPIQPLAAREEPPKLPSYLDCSGSASYIAWLAGVSPAPDPIYGYGGYGFTGSLVVGGRRIATDEAFNQAKAKLVLAFYGESINDTEHVTIVLPDGRVFSHGQESGPEFRNSITYRRDYLQCRAYNVIT
jgi:hypothetical protein